MLEHKQSQHSNFSNSRGNNFSFSDPIRPTIELIRDVMVIYTLTKFGADWLIFVDASVNKLKYSKFSNSRANNSRCSGPIRPIIKLIRHLMVKYILTKCGADWLIFVDSSV